MKPQNTEATEGDIVDHKWLNISNCVQCLTKKETFWSQELNLKLAPGTFSEEWEGTTTHSIEINMFHHCTLYRYWCCCCHHHCPELSNRFGLRLTKQICSICSRFIEWLLFIDLFFISCCSCIYFYNHCFMSGRTTKKTKIIKKKYLKKYIYV